MKWYEVTDAIQTALDGMSAMELNELVKALEDKFGVSATAIAKEVEAAIPTDAVLIAKNKKSLTSS